MPYREKLAWLSLAAMAFGFFPYFYTAAHSTPTAATPWWQAIMPFLGAVIRQVSVLLIGIVVLRRTSREDAKLPADERDRDIQRRSLTSAYYVLIAGMILVGCIMPINQGGWDIINAAVFMIIVAELVHYSIVVWSYRRQA
jgi:hypothetical protein